MLVAKEADLAVLFVSGVADEKTVSALNLQMKNILSVAQVGHYDKLRGYGYNGKYFYHQGH